jgi:pyruvyl transferase EpsO
MMADMQDLKNAVSLIDNVIPSGSKIAFLAYPLHLNIGDLLIWKGAEEYFKNRQLDIIYRASDFFCKLGVGRLPEFPRGVTIVMHGGGNFGDIYKEQQKIREDVLERYPRHRIVVLPQTVYFGDEAALARSAAKFAQHNDVHVFARDERSLDILRQHFHVYSYLCPDMAHFLWGLLPQKHNQCFNNRTLYLMRRDCEQRLPSDTSREVASVDWPDLLGNGDRLFRTMMAGAEFFNHTINRSVMPCLELWRNFADRLIAKACSYFMQFDHVNTSRLHGHILACLLRMPIDLMNNSYGKNWDYYRAWTHCLPTCRWVDFDCEQP